MDYHQSTPRDDGADDVLDDDGVLDVDDDARVVREVRFTRACCVSRARTRAMHEFLNVDRVPMLIIHHLSFTRDDGRTTRTCLSVQNSKNQSNSGVVFTSR